MRVFNYPSELGVRNIRFEDRYPEHYWWLTESRLDFKVRHYVYPDFVTPRTQVNLAQFEFAVEFNDETEATMFALYSRMRPS
jgi:hypothetical protein